MRFKYYLRGAGIGVIAATLILSIAFLLQDQISDEEVIRRAIELGMVMEDEKESSPGTLADMGQQGASSVDLETGTDGPADETDGSTAADGSGDGQDLSGNTTEPDFNQDGDDQGEGQGAGSGNSHDSGQDTDSGDIQDSGQKDAGSGDSDQKTPDSSSSDKKDSNKKDSDDKNSDKKDDKEDTDKKDSDRPNRRPSGNTATVTIEAGDVSRIVSAKVFEAGLVESADEFNSYLGEHGYANQLQPGTYEINKDATFRQIAVILTTRQ